MGLFKKRATDPAEIDRLKAEIASMNNRLQASEAAKGELDTTVRGLVTRLETPAPPPPEPPPVVPTVDPAELDKLNAKIERLANRIDDDNRDDENSVLRPAVEELTAKMQRIGERIDQIDQRISSISNELANQITELSDDIEALGGREPATDDVVDELRDAQTRIAAEQARYQIAFRQDLAELADRLRRA